MSKATEQSANEVAVLLEERFCKYIPKSSKSLAAINKKYRKIPFDENNIPLTFIKTFCGIEKLCHYRFLFNSKDGILNNLMKESKNNTSPTDYTQTSIELSNAIHFMSQSNEKLLSKFPFFRHCLNSQNLITKIRENLAAHAAKAEEFYNEKLAKYLEIVFKDSSEMTKLKSGAVSKKNSLVTNVKVNLIGLIGNAEQLSHQSNTNHHDMSISESNINNNQYSADLISSELKEFHQASQICQNFGIAAILYKQFFDQIRSNVIEPALKGNKVIKIIKTFEGYASGSISLKPSLPDLSVEDNIKFFMKFFSDLFNIGNSDEIDCNVYNFYLHKYIWDWFIENFFYGDYLWKSLEKPQFVTNILPLYEMFEKKMNSKKYLKVDESNVSNTLLTFKINEFLASASKLSLDKNNDMENKFKNESLVREILNMNEHGQNKYEEGEGSHELVSHLKSAYNLEMSDMVISIKSLKAIRAYYSRFNEAIEDIRKEMSVGLFKLHASIQFIETFLKPTVNQINTSKELSQNMSTIDQINTDISIINFAVMESICNSSLVDKLPKTCLLFLSDEAIYFQKFIKFSTLVVFKQIDEKLRGFIGRGYGERRIEIGFENVVNVLSKFVERRGGLFIKALDLVIDGFINILIAEIDGKLSNLGNKLGKDDINLDERIKKLYLDQNNSNRFFKIARNNLLKLQIQVEEIINRHLDFWKDKNNSSETAEDKENYSRNYNRDEKFKCLGLLKLNSLIEFTQSNTKSYQTSTADFNPIHRSIPTCYLQTFYAEMSKHTSIFSERQIDAFVGWFLNDGVEEDAIKGGRLTIESGGCKKKGGFRMIGF